MAKRKGGGSIYLLMTLAAFFWAGAFIAGKFGVREMPPITLTFLRFLLATAVIFPVMMRMEPDRWRLNRRDVPLLALLGLIGIFGYHVLFFIALKYTSAINSSMLAAVNPLVASILAALFVGENLGPKRLGAILLALFGVLLTITGGDPAVIRNLTFNIGDLIMLCGVLCMATYGVLSKRATAKYPPIVVLSWAFLFGLVIMAPLTLAEHPLGAITSAGWRCWASIVYMAVFASCLGYLFQQMGFRRIGVNGTMPFFNLVPAFSIVLSALILGEHITAVKIVSAAIIIAGVYLNSRIGVERSPGRSVR